MWPELAIGDLDRPVSVATGDLDLDGDLDLVTGGTGDPPLGSFLHEADGWSVLRGIAPEATGADRVSLVDLDGDGFLDLLSNLDPGTFADVTWHRGDGLGAFALPRPLGASGPVSALAAGDLDKDGDPDIAFAIADDNRVGWFENRGRGAFASLEIISLFADDVVSLALADLDLDADLDLLVAQRSADEVAWFENLNPGWGARVVLDTGNWASRVVAADFDRDGDPDVADAWAAVDQIRWIENLGSGSFNPSIGITTAFGQPEALGVADLDGDGDGDPVAGGSDADQLIRIDNLGAGVFAAPQVFAAFGAPLDVAFGDLDLDGDTDVLAPSASYERVAWFENPGFADADADGLSDAAEVAAGSDPVLADTDGGGLGDAAEDAAGTDPRDPEDDGWVDRDADGSSDETEGAQGTDPSAGDTDGDGAYDGRESLLGTDPLLPDTDGDGLLDGTEDACGTDPLTADLPVGDCDGDGVDDADEAAAGTDPLLPDTDGDGANDDDEAAAGTDPLTADTDAGGRPDGLELALGRDPLVPGDDWAATPFADWVTGADQILCLDVQSDGIVDLVFRDEATSRVVAVEGQGDGAFAAGQSLLEGPIGVRLASADLDGDGDRDLVAVQPDLLTWFEADGFTFDAHAIALTAPEPVAVEATDVDGDGDPDLVIADADRAELSWVENRGGGILDSQRVLRTTVQGLTGLAVGDLDADGDADLLVPALWTGDLGWLPNLGAGAFGPWEPVGIREASEAILADLDLDGLPDVVAISGQETLAWRNEGGSFSAAIALDAGDGARQPVAADLDGDGDYDVATIVESDGTIRWVRNEGATFSLPIEITADLDSASALTACDADGDGDADLPSASATDHWLYWNGGYPDADADGRSDAAELANGTDPSDPQDPPPAPYPVGWDLDRDGVPDGGAQADNAADADADGLSDAAERATNTDPTVADTDGGGRPDGTEVTEGRNPLDPGDDWLSHPVTDALADIPVIAAVDLDRDGWLDIAMAASDQDQVGVASGLGGGTFGAVAPVPGEANLPTDLAVADLDGDGWLDLAASRLQTGGVAWWVNLGDRTFAPGEVVDPALNGPAVTVATGDLDLDGDPDLITNHYGEMYWAERLPSRAFAPFARIADNETTDVAVADLDGDGDPDLLLTGTFGVSWLEDPTAPLGGTLHLIGNDPGFRVVAHDLDADGDEDVIAAMEPAGVLWYENIGPGVFTVPVALAFGNGPQRPAIGDLDGDGDPDVVLAFTAQDRLGWVQNLGAGRFAAEAVVAADAPGSTAVALGDADGDGDRDVFVGTNATSPVAWLENRVAPPDADRDGLSDASEAEFGTDPLVADTDAGGRSDAAEVALRADPLDPTDDLAFDTDADTQSDADEAVAGTDPLAWDTDGDGLSDGLEPVLGTDPLLADTDGDGQADADELGCSTDPLDPSELDTDCDGLFEDAEAAAHTDPTLADTDGDGLGDYEEVVETGTDPLLADTDGGGTGDLEEVSSRQDPHDPHDDWARSTIASDPSPIGLCLADLDLDGDRDVVVSFGEPDPRVSWIEALPGGVWGSATSIVAAERDPVGLTCADLDNDGDSDVLVGLIHSVRWFENLRGTFLEHTAIHSGQTSALAPADLDLDGVPELLFSGSADEDRIEVHAQTGEQYEWIAEIGDEPARELSSADLDGDGRPDVLAITATRRAKLRWFDADDVAHHLDFAPDPTATVLADLDGDGDPEIAVGGHGSIDVLDNNEGTGFGPPARLAEGIGEVNVVRATDLDRDGRIDLVAATVYGAYWLPNRKEDPPIRLPVAGEPLNGLAVADVDGDGADDLVATSREVGLVWYRNGLAARPPEAEEPDEARPSDEPGPSGCGCQSSPPTPIAWIAGLLVFARRRRV